MSILVQYPHIPPMDIIFYTDAPYKTDRFRRGKCQVLLGAMSQCPIFRDYTTDVQTNMVMQIEKGCVNATLTKAREDNISPSWDNIIFRRMYASLIMEIAEAIDWENHHYLMARIVAGKIKLSAIGSLPTTDLVPKSDAVKLVEARRSAKIDMKTTSMYTCPNCSKKQALFCEIQIRAGDEAKDTQLICVYCMHDWIERA